jgi:hypothetical protein
MKRPRFYVDFNELIERDLIAPAKDETKHTSTGERFFGRDWRQKSTLTILNDKGEPDNLIASGVVERNSAVEWAEQIKWNCRIDSYGIRHESDLTRQ